MQRQFEKVRRFLLRRLIPEFVWPKEIILDGVRIPVRGMPFSFGVKKILCKGTYEASERALLVEILREGDRILEMGGSIGILATIASAKIGKTGRVVSIEPSKVLAEHSRLRHACISNVSIVNGLGFPVDRIPSMFHIGEFSDDGNSLGGHVDFSKVGPSVTSSLRSYSIGDINEEFSLNPNILLVDIEGSEIVLLEANTSLAPCITYVIIELHPNIYGPDTERRIVRRFEELGFSIDKEISHVYRFVREGRACNLLPG